MIITYNDIVSPREFTNRELFYCFYRAQKSRAVLPFFRPSRPCHVSGSRFGTTSTRIGRAAVTIGHITFRRTPKLRTPHVQPSTSQQTVKKKKPAESNRFRRIELTEYNFGVLLVNVVG